MSVNLRWEQCCETERCTKPARHGSLCAACFLAATPAQRATELLAGGQSREAVAPPDDDYVSADGVLWLERLWAA